MTTPMDHEARAKRIAYSKDLDERLSREHYDALIRDIADELRAERERTIEEYVAAMATVVEVARNSYAKGDPDERLGKALAALESNSPKG